MFKSIRSFIIIGAIFGVTVGSAKLVSNFQTQLGKLGVNDSPYAAGLLIIILLASPLFVSTLSHNVINEEVKTRTIRFIATKTSREKIILGKFLGILFFWFTCIFVASLLLIPFSKTFHYLELLQSVIFVTYFIGLCIALSTIISKPGITSFLSMALSIALTFLGLWSMISDNIYLKIYSYITPYYYFNQENEYLTLIVIIFPAIFLLFSLIIFRKKDL